MTRLLLGPLLRHVGATDATVWVETDAATEVEVRLGDDLAHRARTFEVAGHHYALVVVDGLSPGSETTYDVRLEGERVWPEFPSAHPPTRIRTLASEEGRAGLTLAFGSCRYARPAAVEHDRHFDADALDALAVRLAGSPAEQWPDALLLLGDQVYADETTEATQRRIRARRDITRGPKEQVADFEEYTWLYHESWTDPDVRWLLSTLPSSMIFDDHDVRDDWNTSAAWRADMARTSWWSERIIGALTSYWVYQHIGNLSPQLLAEDEAYQQVLTIDGDCEPLLRDLAVRADAEADGGKGARWSYRRDFPGVRLVVLDSRCGRLLEDGRHDMLSDAEFTWFAEQLDGEYDHLLVGTSLPWLLPRALHDVEAWNERLAGGARGERMARAAEWLRRAADLEHWAAFRDSFDRLSDLLAAVGRRPGAPSTICVLSGDVHHAYAARALFPEPVDSRVYQLTCSPVHNYVPVAMQVAFRVAWSRLAEHVTRLLLDRVAHVPRQALRWERMAGPYYGNEIATLLLQGRSARLLIEKATERQGSAVLDPVADVRLG